MDGKQDAIKYAQKAKGLKDIGAPEFYNMQMERPGGDENGFGLLFCDAMHYNNFAARMSHSCEPNVQVILTVVDGKYEIHFYATREIQKGEELCYNYHSCSDSMKEVEAAFVCAVQNGAEEVISRSSARTTTLRFLKQNIEYSIGRQCF